jgi:hypothetical protein
MTEENTEKDAEVLYESKHVEGELEITEKAKYIDETTNVYITPCGTKVKAKDIINVLEEYYNLTPSDRNREKSIWVELISKMIGTREDGLKIVDIELAENGEKQIKFVYR